MKNRKIGGDPFNGLTKEEVSIVKDLQAIINRHPDLSPAQIGRAFEEAYEKVVGYGVHGTRRKVRKKASR